jgi:hypothetical protein
VGEVRESGLDEAKAYKEIHRKRLVFDPREAVGNDDNVRAL